MADTKQKQIIDAIVTALEGITGVGKVTQDEREYSGESVDDYPRLLVQHSKPRVEPISYPSSTADDMEAELEITIQGVVHNINTSNIDGDMDELMQDVEQAMAGNASLAALVKEVWPESDENVADLDQNYGIFAMSIVAMYHYNHNTP